MSIRVAIFDDNKNIRNSIILLLNIDPDFEMVGSFSDAVNCVEKVLSCQPDIVLIDIEMPQVNGIDAIKKLKKEIPRIDIIIQTVFEDEEKIFASLKAGATCYILKSGLSHVGEAIRETHSGGAMMMSWVAREILNIHNLTSHGKVSALDGQHLTRQDCEILGQLVIGQSYTIIAQQMKTSPDLLKELVKKIYQKLHLINQ
ncbi:response regulator transcription factor [Pedobacter sp. ISL-68]|uniref:response regulator transcription factor n=1 Tax=unclassified Pedobacter TaxID=2628915 RepID=UPI001BE9C3CF|nr:MULTISPECIES: response regulator transcription factor [unclassified Pedobacter]MBT2560238.1 response regulator transcription factor [Pedobacter sp. ISL-64]MBT2589218.1 response regulator transcription factor [Pedobacter sp. ISL-68]